jgi:PhnB protein
MNICKIKKRKMEKGQKAVKAIPEGYHSVTPILVVKNAPALIDFLKQTFNAKEKYRMAEPDGTIMHAEVAIGDSAVMLAEANEPRAPMQTGLYVYVEDVDGTFQKAIKAGASPIMQPEDKFYGDRSGAVKDPMGNTWWISKHVEDVSPEEMHAREEKFMQKH